MRSRARSTKKDALRCDSDAVSPRRAALSKSMRRNASRGAGHAARNGLGDGVRAASCAVRGAASMATAREANDIPSLPGIGRIANEARRAATLAESARRARAGRSARERDLDRLLLAAAHERDAL